MIIAVPPLYLDCPESLNSVSEARGHWKLSEERLSQQYDGALKTANSVGLDPRYEYLLVKEGVFGALNGIGLSVPKFGDDFLYTNRQWVNGELSPSWGPIRKLTLAETHAAGVTILFTSTAG